MIEDDLSVLHPDEDTKVDYPFEAPEGPSVDKTDKLEDNGEVTELVKEVSEDIDKGGIAHG